MFFWPGPMLVVRARGHPIQQQDPLKRSGPTAGSWPRPPRQDTTLLRPSYYPKWALLRG